MIEEYEKKMIELDRKLQEQINANKALKKEIASMSEEILILKSMNTKLTKTNDSNSTKKSLEPGNNIYNIII